MLPSAGTPALRAAGSETPRLPASVAPAAVFFAALVWLPLFVAVAFSVLSELQVVAVVLGLLGIIAIPARRFWGLVLFVALLYVRPEEVVPEMAGSRVALVISLATLIGTWFRALVSRCGDAPSFCRTAGRNPPARPEVDCVQQSLRRCGMERGISELFDSLDREAPETRPEARRSVPPRYPPAPSGTAWAGGDGGEEPKLVHASLSSQFQVCANLAARLAVAIDRQETVAEESRQAQYLRAEVHACRAGLAHLLRDLYDRINPESSWHGWTDLRRFKKALLRLMVAGQPRWRLDRALETDVFARVGRNEVVGSWSVAAERYQYPLTAHVDSFRLGLLSPGDFIRLVLRDFVSVAAEPASSVSRHSFEREVIQRLLALVYAASQAWTGPYPETTPADPLLSEDGPALDPEEQRIRAWKRRAAENGDGA